MKGTCLCGQSAVVTEERPFFSMLCHCKSCRVVTGLASAMCIFRQDKVHLSGDLSSYEYRTPNGDNMVNHFCPVCATVVCRTPSAMPGMVCIPLGLLDEAEDLKPDVEVWTAEKLPWLIAEGAVDSATEGAGVSERLTMILSSLEEPSADHEKP